MAQRLGDLCFPDDKDEWATELRHRWIGLVTCCFGRAMRRRTPCCLTGKCYPKTSLIGKGERPSG